MHHILMTQNHLLIDQDSWVFIYFFFLFCRLPLYLHNCLWNYYETPNNFPFFYSNNNYKLFFPIHMGIRDIVECFLFGLCCRIWPFGNSVIPAFFFPKESFLPSYLSFIWTFLCGILERPNGAVLNHSFILLDCCNADLLFLHKMTTFTVLLFLIILHLIPVCRALMSLYLHKWESRYDS